MGSEIVLALLGTILTSGVVSGIVTYKLNASREDRLFRRQRLEELHEAFFEISRGLGAHWVPYLGAMENQITYNQALDLVNDREQEPFPIARMQMLASLYHPQYVPLVDELLAIRDEANDVIYLHKERYKQEGPHEAAAAVRRMRQVSDRLTDLEDRFTNYLRASTT